MAVHPIRLEMKLEIGSIATSVFGYKNEEG